MNDLDFEADYWGDCANTVDEDTKHFVYAKYMGLDAQYPRAILHPNNGVDVADIGGGPTSMLLKTCLKGTVIDPLMKRFPDWVRDRYTCHGLNWSSQKGEDLNLPYHDESWIYSVLQHTEDPAAVVASSLKIAPVLRFFEWCFLPPHEGHPHEITPGMLMDAFEAAAVAQGKRKSLEIHLNGVINEMGCVGHAFAGVVRLS